MGETRILLGMSGGMDSSVTAKILLEKGFLPEGITLWLSGDEASFKDKADAARKVCRKLGIPHHVADFRGHFERNVIDYFINAYLSGITPNPCVFCNMSIKFGTMLDWAEKNGFDKIATGHYAKIRYDRQRKRYILYKSIDDKKDQTYFLYGLTQHQLSKAIMPLGDFRKEEIRDTAVELGYNADLYKDSQEICFVPNGNYIQYIMARTGQMPKKGWFIDMDGNKIGQHEGILSYTIGQRKGLGLSLGYPGYVIAINTRDNTVVIGGEKDLYKNSMSVYQFNSVKYESVPEGIYNVKIRHSKKEAPAYVRMFDDFVSVDFLESQRAITPGQSAVLYEGNDIVGGGIIGI